VYRQEPEDDVGVKWRGLRSARLAFGFVNGKARLCRFETIGPWRQESSMDTLEPNSIVILSLHSPKEKLWGALTAINSAGVTVRGIDLNSFDDFIRQVMDPDGERIGLPTLFFPMQRVERIALDEPHGSIPSMAGRFEQRVGRSLRDYLALFV
jgi:hypothetical protein